MKLWHLIVSFIAGVIAGVLGIGFYEIFGKPVEPYICMDLDEYERITKGSE